MTECTGHREHSDLPGRKHIYILEVQEIRPEKLWTIFKGPICSSYRVWTSFLTSWEGTEDFLECNAI